MFEEVVVIDRIEVLDDGVIQVRESTSVLKNGTKVGHSSLKRWCLVPGQDVSDQDSKVQSVCSAVWTEEVVAAYLASRVQF